MSASGQKARILRYLREGNVLTRNVADAMGIARLGARIYELKAEGYRILSQYWYVGRIRYATYHLELGGGK